MAMNSKYIMIGIAALTLCAGFTSCSHDFDDVSSGEEVINLYNQKFVEAFGQPAANQNWGFDAPATPVVNSTTRAITVNNDYYSEFNFPSEEELTTAFPTAIPTDADEVADLVNYIGREYTDQYGTHTASDLYAVYVNFIKKGHNLKVTSAGEVEIGGTYQNIIDGEVQYYNVYVDVEGDLTIKRSGAAHYNLYVLRGNVTLPVNYGEQAGVISVAEGATLNDQRNSIAANQGVRLYNRGTVNATNTEKYDIGNNSTVYNEGTFTVSGPLSYSPGAGNTSYFINFGDDAELTAPSMTMNSTCHFFTDGTVNIAGQTKVTQVDITWINNGHYTTGSMVFSAKNGTFYNYCQLIVRNNCNFTDGIFNMMQNSYAEFGTGLFNNFRVNMHDNSGFNVKGGTKWGRQGADFIYAHEMQGFIAVDDNARVFVRLAGDNQIPAYKGYAFNVQGANLTLAYDRMAFYKGFNEIGLNSTYDAVTYWNETTAEILETNGDEDKTWNLHNVTKVVTGEAFAETGFTLTEGDCAATWNGGTPPEEETWGEWIRVIAEDLSANQPTDFDFNDVVFDVRINTAKTKAQIKLKAAGGTLPLTVGWTGEAGISYTEFEVHNLYGVSTNVMVNTHAKNGVDGKADVIKTLKGTFNSANDVKVMVQKRGVWYDIEAHVGEPASKLAVGTDYEWCDERQNINDKYSNFSTYVQENTLTVWWNAEPIIGE